METFNKTKMFKRITIILVFLILFNFTYPTVVRAGVLEDIYDTITGIPGKISDMWDSIKNLPSNIVNSFTALVAKLFGYAVTGICHLLFVIEDGIMVLANNMFCIEFSGTYNGATALEADPTTTADDIRLEPYSIISGKFALMNANIFKKITAADADPSNPKYYDVDSATTNVGGAKNDLRITIARWYSTLRNFAIVGLLSVLVYVAIRMIISTATQDKAKYKLMLKDWFIALALVIFLHFMMVAMLNITELVTDALRSNNSTNSIEATRGDIITELAGVYSKISNFSDWSSLDTIWSPLGSLAGKIFIYAALIVFTGIFLVKYVVRALLIMFLTLLAPVTAITYPIDKMGDGKSQAYDAWFKEYFYNIIIQPFHMLLYTVLIGAASTLADTNLIYCILCYAVMIPAEKIIKDIFGFKDKLGSPLGALATGALAQKAISSAKSKIDGREKAAENEKKNSGNKDGQTQLPPKQKSDAELGAFDDGTDAPALSSSSSKEPIKETYKEDIPETYKEDIPETYKEDIPETDDRSLPGPSNASAAIAFQNSSDAESEALEKEPTKITSIKAASKDFSKKEALERGEGISKGIREGNINEETLPQKGRKALAYYRHVSGEEKPEINQYKYNIGKNINDRVIGTGQKSEEELPEKGRKALAYYRQVEQGRQQEEPEETLQQPPEQQPVQQQPEQQPEQQPVQQQPEHQPVQQQPIQQKPVQPNSEQNQPSRLQQFARGVRSEIGKDVRKKYGTTNGLKVLGKATGKVAGKAGRFVAKAGFGLLGAGLAALVTLPTGNFKAVGAAMLGGASLGSSTGNRVAGMAGRGASRLGRYASAGRASAKGQSQVVKSAKKDFMNNESQRDYARQRLYERNGYEPSAKEIQAEMESRWKFIEDNGIRDNDIIDRELDFAAEKEQQLLDSSQMTAEFNEVEQSREGNEDYKKDYDRLFSDNLIDKKFDDKAFDKKYGEGAADKAKEHHDTKEKAHKVAFSQASFAGQIAKETSKADFRDDKKMGQLQKNMTEQYMKDANVSRERAVEVSNKAIINAAKIKGVQNPNIPGTQEKSESTTSQSKPVNRTSHRQSANRTSHRQSSNQTSHRQSANRTSHRKSTKK